MQNRIFAATLVALAIMAGAPAYAHGVNDPFAGAKKLSGVVPAMGEHWMHPRYPGAIFGRMNGKTVFVEYEVEKKDLAGTKAVRWDGFEMPGFVGRIDHTDIHYLPQGRPGREVPLLQIHMYTVPHAEHMGYKPSPGE